MVESNVRLGPNTHGPGDWEEILQVEKIALEDEGVKSAIAKLGLPKDTAIVSDPWIYGKRSPHSNQSQNLIQSRIRWRR